MNLENFQKLNIKPAVLRVIEEMGYTTPTEIQERAIPILSTTNKDFIGQAQTGTGKTAAFVIPLLERIDCRNTTVQALILTPTRELAMQVENEICKLGKYTEVRSTSIYGGSSYEKQIRALRHDKPQIVVGTPGRVIDLIKKNILKLENAKYCVLDEADEMLNMGFFEDVQTILELFNEKRQLFMFSATMPRSILNLIQKSFREYEMVKIENNLCSSENIEQKYFVVRDKYFKEALARIIEDTSDLYGLIFCRTKIETKEVGDDLKKRGYGVEVLNGDMGQAERDLAMRNFKSKKVEIMVCTDVAARGIDVSNLTHVFNYGLPQDKESYIHRIGRTGRAGLKGKAYTIVGPKSTFALRRIESHINKRIDCAKLPSISDLKRRVVEKEISSVQQILETIKTKGDDFKMDSTYEVFKNSFGELSHDDLLKLLFSWKFNKALRNYNDLSDIEHFPKENFSSMPRDRRSRSRNFRDSGPRRGRSRSYRR